MIKKGSWIEVEQVVYCNEKIPVKIFIRGNCINDCNVGESSEVKVITGQVVKGIVSRGNLFYNNIRNLGKDVKEILMVGK